MLNCLIQSFTFRGIRRWGIRIKCSGPSMRAGAAHPMGIVVLYFCLFAIEHNAWHINTMHHLSVLEVRKLNLVTAGLYSTGMFKGRVCFQAFPASRSLLHSLAQKKLASLQPLLMSSRLWFSLSTRCYKDPVMTSGPSRKSRIIPPSPDP